MLITGNRNIRFVVRPYSTYLFTVGVEIFLFPFDHTQTHTTVGRPTLDEGSARRRDLYLTTQKLYKRQTSMPPVGWNRCIPVKNTFGCSAVVSCAFELSLPLFYLIRAAHEFDFRQRRKINSSTLITSDRRIAVKSTFDYSAAVSCEFELL
jgi:hypothetical protein